MKIILVRVGFIVYFLFTFIHITKKEVTERDSLDIFLVILVAALILESAFELSKTLRNKS